MSAIDNFVDDSLDLELLNEAELHKLLDQPLPDNKNAQNLRTGEQHAGFDNNTGESWIYPTNLPMRTYQYSITQASLYRNTLVVLPTGLGKTFIAAVVMYNLYRWYPTGKVIFMAPTRPLVAQQIEACQRIMPFPSRDTVELTGRLAKQKRIELWRSKRVFFATPQVVQSDIIGERDSGVTDFPFDQIKLLVIDEAHKAKGRYAYTEVTQSIYARNRYFRVLALSATPGRTMEDVAEVCRNLFISHLEVRWDSSIDVSPYVHRRHLKTIAVPLGDEISEVRERLLEIIDPYTRELVDADILSSAINNLNRNFLLFEQKRFRERNQHERHPQYSTIMGNFSTCISLYHALELLERHGLCAFINNFEQDEDGNNKYVLNMNARLRELVESVKKQRSGDNPFNVSAQTMTNGQIAPMPKSMDFGHPKFEEARKCLLEHFESHADSRAIVFCEYRESVMLIYRLLLQHTPLLRPRCFVGQGGTTGSIRALSQKQQLQIMNDFRSGKSNILIATSVGEEGIDVGEVELIVCFDISSSNPTRFIQRIGRTGRKKNGNVVMLVTEGREAQLLKEVLANKDQINMKLIRSTVVKNALYQHAPRLVPTEFNPKCVQTFIKHEEKEKEAPADVDAAKLLTKNSKIKSKKTTTQIAVKGSQDLRKFFKQAKTEPILDAVEREIFNIETTQTTPQLSTQLKVKLRKSFSKMENKLFIPATATQQPNNHTQQQQKCTLDAAYIRKVNKLLQSGKPLLSEAQRSTDLMQQLKSKTLNKNVKLCLIRQQRAFVQSIQSQMQVLQALDVSVSEMSSQEQQIRKNYELILEQFDGDEMKLLKIIENPIESIDNYNILFNVQQEAALDAATDCIFKGLAEPDFCCDNFDYIAEAMKSLETRRDELKLKELSMCLPGESMVYSNLMQAAEDEYEEEHTIYDIGESKYLSQIEQMENGVCRQKCTMEDLSTTSASELELNEVQIVEQQAYNTPVLHTKTTEAFTSLLERQSSSSTPRNNHKMQPKRINCETANTHTDNTMLSKLNFDFESKTPQAFNSLLEQRQSSSTPRNTKLQSLKRTHTDTFSEFKNDLEPLESKTPQAFTSLLARHSSSSTPRNNNKVQPKRINNESLIKASTDPLSELDNDLEAFMENFDFDQVQQQTATSKATTKTPTTKPINLLHDFEINADDFLDPLPEEQLLSQNSKTELKESTARNQPKQTPSPTSLERKENYKSELNLLPIPPQLKSTAARHSPDLFNETISPIKPMATKPASLASKLAAKCRKEPERAVKQEIDKSPKTRLKTDSKKYEKSPSVFDIYMQNMRGRGKIPRKELTIQKNLSKNISADESIIALPKRGAKRKIIDSDSETENKNKTPPASEKYNSSDDFESIAATQLPFESLKEQRQKRRKFNSFIECEAAQSGSDASEDDAEYTIGAYIKDSVIVSSDDEVVDEAAHSQVQAMYLQAVISPHMRRGAFKIPAKRVYNDESNIFSQAVEPESQYLPDSFIQEDENVSHNVSLCPLERAERILKERRRRKRLGLDETSPTVVTKPTKRRRVQRMGASSSDDE